MSGIRSLPLVALLVLSAPGHAAAVETSAGRADITRIADGLDEPWSVAFLPDGGFLVTERGGRLLRYPSGGGAPVALSGLPDVFARGQGGLFDILVPRDFASSGEVLFSYAEPQGTALARARIEGDALVDMRRLWAMPEGSSGGRHFGGRLIEAADGTIFLTLGERGEGALSQDMRRLNGKIIRLNRDGSVPAGNPFATEQHPEIWTLGHRNPQGAALDAAGQLWVSEHGARGGDEVNRVTPGANYGWPVISYGTDYDGTRIGIGTEAAGMQQPAHYWDPSIAPSGHVIYSGKLWPDWAGDHFVGSLKFDMIARLDPDSAGEGGWAEERIKSRETGRVRDIREAPDGSLWFLSVERGALYRMAPEGR